MSNNYIKSPLNYTGGKHKLLPQILPLFPDDIGTFVDLFCGGANVGINVQANTHYYNDINTSVIGLLNCLSRVDAEEFISNIKQIIKKYNLSDSTLHSYSDYGCNGSDGLGSYNKVGFNNLKNDFNKRKAKNLTYYEMFFTLIVFAFNNQIRFNSKGDYNLPVGKRDFNNAMINKTVDFINKLQSQHAFFDSFSFDRFDISKLDETSLVYCDPPYLITTASYNENGGWNEHDEIKLLKFLDSLNEFHIKFALSNVIEHKGKTNIILQDWISQNDYSVHNLNYNYNNSSYHGKNIDKKTQEVLVTNYWR